MATYKKFDKWAKNICDYNYIFQDIGDPTTYPNNLYFALTNQLPDKVNDEFISDITEVSYTNLLTSRAVTWQTSYESDGDATGNFLAFPNSSITITAKSTGSVGPFRYIVFYLVGFTDVSSFSPLVCYYDYGYSITLSANQLIRVYFRQSLLSAEWTLNRIL